MTVDFRSCRRLALLGAVSLFSVVAMAQATQPPPADDKPIEQADEPADTTPLSAHASRAAATAKAWQLLDTGMTDSKPEVRISAVTALGTISHSKQAAPKIEKALTDSDRDVRLAAVHAAGAIHSPLLTPALRNALDDPAPDISFTASEVLWQMGDHSGQDILTQVVTGERKSSPGFIKSSLHTANKDMHSPSTLAVIGAEQGAYALMGPFGVGLDAARLMMKSSNTANSARVTAVLLIASDKSKATNSELTDALGDKDYFVRAAAARGLGDFHNKETAQALVGHFEDSKPLVRYMAAAAYIRSTGSTGRLRASAHILNPAHHDDTGTPTPPPAPPKQ